MNCEQAQDLITALADNELFGPERAALEAHLKECSKCRFAHAQEQALKTEIHRAGADIRAPAELREKILHDPRIFPQGRASGKQSTWATNRYFRPTLAAALIVLLLIPALYLIRRAETPVSSTVFAIHEKLVSGALPAFKASTAEEIKEMLFRAASGAFAPMSYDLAIIDLKAVGGAVQEFDGRKVLVTIYEGRGRSLTCYTLLGAETDAPAGAGVVYDAETKVTYYTYSSGEMNAVFHRDGKLICILVSRLPMAELLAVARSNPRPTPLFSP